MNNFLYISRIFLICSFILNLNISIFSQPAQEISNTTATEDTSKQNNENKRTDADTSEFKSVEEITPTDEFKEFVEKKEKVEDRIKKVVYRGFYWALVALFFTIIAGILVRYRQTRKLRYLLLLCAIIFLGFYNGACPCPISSLSSLILAIIGVKIQWQSLIWFLGLIPVTYVFGKVWCGWLCHLGALQEFISMPAKFQVFKTQRALKVMRIIRYILFATFIVQLIITKSYLFARIDPFKVAYNLFSTNLTGWILLGILLICSLFIYRPFCKSACPIIVILGLIDKIPGASIIRVNKNCIDCVSCENNCKMGAIPHMTGQQDKSTKIRNKDCIVCSDCFDVCKNDGIEFNRIIIR